MRVDAYSAVSQIYQTSKNIKSSSTARTYGSDKCEISQFGKDYQIAKKALGEIPDVREDKVAEIKNAIDEGTYNVSAEDFAAKLAEKYGTTLF